MQEKIFMPSINWIERKMIEKSYVNVKNYLLY